MLKTLLKFTNQQYSRAENIDHVNMIEFNNRLYHSHTTSIYNTVSNANNKTNERE
jgi:hypothetical protein